MRIAALFSALLCGGLFFCESHCLAQGTNWGAAVDATNLVWTSGGNTNWFVETGDVPFDGIDDARSGGYLPAGTNSWLETIVNGPGTLSFWWKVQGCFPLENPPGDYLEFYTNGQLQAQITGRTGWQYWVTNLPGGSQTLRWRYAKGNHPGGCGDDCGRLDQVIFNTTASIPLANAVDTCGGVWSSGGNNNPTYWNGQTNVTHDGVDAAQSGAITDDQESWMACTVSGVTNVSFWWKVSCQTDPSSDVLEFYTNAILVASISGEKDWTSNSFRLSPNTNALLWRYSKDSGIAMGQDRGWVDQISFKPPLNCLAESFSLSSPFRLPNGSVQFSVLIGDEYSCQVQYSTNLPSTNWLTLTNFPANTVKTVVDPSATNSAQRFYRGVSP